MTRSRRSPRRAATPVAPVIADATPVADATPTVIDDLPVAADLTPADLTPVADPVSAPAVETPDMLRAAYHARRNLGSMSLMNPAERAAFLGYASANVNPGSLASFFRDPAVLSADDASALITATPRALVTVALSVLSDPCGANLDALNACARDYYAPRGKHGNTDASDLEIRDCAVRYAGRLMYRASRDAFRLAFASLPGRFGSRVHTNPDPADADIIRVRVLRDACSAFLASAPTPA